jgi:hypothetical protein
MPALALLCEHEIVFLPSDACHAYPRFVKHVRIEPNGRCQECGDPAVVTYEDLRDRDGRAMVSVARDTICSNPQCRHHPGRPGSK